MLEQLWVIQRRLREEHARAVAALRDNPLPEGEKAPPLPRLILVDTTVAEGGYSKPTPARYEVNPKLHRQFAAVAERERERRAVIREAIAEAAHARRDARQEEPQD